MAIRGRKQVPARIKELSGTVRKDRIREGVEFLPVSEVPKPEVWMSTKAKKYFRLICEQLIRVGLLDEANIPLVALMSEEFATYEKAVRAIKKEGEVITAGKNNYPMPNPWMALRNQSQKNYRDIAALFGLDPLSAQKIGPVKKDDSDPFEKLMEKYD